MAKRKMERKDLDRDHIYRILFESAGEGLVITDKEGNIKLTNPRIADMFGYDQDELHGLAVEQLLPESMRSGHERRREGYMKQPAKRSMGQNLSLMALRKDRTEFPVEVSLNHFTSEGEFYVMALITDITVRKQADENLFKLNLELEKRVDERTREVLESQRLYRAIAQNFPNGVINVLDSKLQYVFAEGKDLKRQGLRDVDLTGRNYIQKLQDHSGKEISQYLNNVFYGISVTMEVKIAGYDYLVHAVPLPDVDGTITRILVVEQNVTDQKIAEENARVALQKERQLNELKSRFVSMASHEFRTPLATILSSTALLGKYDKPEFADKRIKHLNRIKQNVGNLTNILNDFLSLDKLETGVVEPKLQAVDLHALMVDFLEEMQEMAKEDQKFILENSAGPIELFTDKAILRNILNNLGSNAIKYSPGGVLIHVNCLIKAKRVCISIKDAGIGIPISEQQHLFERFFRANNATNIQGTGLGLNIVKRYLDVLGGTINFESAEGVGTTFTICLPYNL